MIGDAGNSGSADLSLVSKVVFLRTQKEGIPSWQNCSFQPAERILIKKRWGDSCGAVSVLLFSPPLHSMQTFPPFLQWETNTHLRSR